jgi:hypothetical protein
MSDTRWANHIVVQIDKKFTVLYQQLEEGCNVSRIELTRVNRHSRGKIRGGSNGHAVLIDRLVGPAQSTIATRGACQVDYNGTTFHSGDSFCGYQQGCPAAGYLGAGDYHVGRFGMFGD